MKKKLNTLYITLIILTMPVNFFAKKGFIIVTVADLTGQPLGSAYAYTQLPWAAHGSDYAACPRVHQLLFNEQVEMLAHQGDETKVRIPNLFYQTKEHSAPQTDYWTLTCNIRSFETMKSNDQVTIPAPINFHEKQQLISQPIVTLTMPYHDKKTRETFSAGTRFVCATRSCRKAQIPVYRFSQKRNRNEIIRIPNALLYRSDGRTMAQRRVDFVHLLKRWAHTSGIIPYVWGGCSFTQTDPSNQFTTVKTPTGFYYQRDKRKEQAPKAGFDCSGLIARAAQIVGLPYFFKNSYTIAHNLKPLTRNQSLQEGDIIWIPGHVMVISDLKNSRIIEAHAYGSGYGKVHELPLHSVFKGVETGKDLEKAYHAKLSLKRLDHNGCVFATHTTYQLLRIPL